MNYKLTPEKQKLVLKTEALAQEERRITVELIQCLEQISKQMIYAEMGYESLHAFCVRHLKMSEGSAYRRISAMRLSRDVPAVREKILSGELSLSNAAKIQSSTHKVQKARNKHAPFDVRVAEKTQIVEGCLNLSQRECEVKLFTELPELREHPSFKESSRLLDESHTELKLVLNADLKSKIDELQNLLSHSNPEKSCLKLIERLVDQELTKLKKQRAPKVQKSSSEQKVSVQKESARGIRNPAQTSNTQIDYKGTNLATGQTPVKSSSAKDASAGNLEVSKSIHTFIFSRFIPAVLVRFVWTRAQNRCQYPACKSQYKLQIEHIIPVAKGGQTVAENLELLCRTHNLLRAIQEFGEEKMQRFISN